MASSAALTSASVNWRSGTAADNRRVAIGDPELKLTSLSHGAGCACKLSPAAVQRVIADLPVSQDPNLLVSHTTVENDWKMARAWLRRELDA